MSVLEQSFPKYATAQAAAVDWVDSNGAQLNLYSFQQLEFLSPAALRTRALEIEDAYQKAGKELPYPLSSRNNDDTIYWILVCQSFLAYGEVTDDSLRRFGVPSALIWKENTRVKSTRQSSPPILQLHGAGDASVDCMSRLMGHEKRHIKPPRHYHIGDEFLEGPEARQTQRHHFSLKAHADPVTGDMNGEEAEPRFSACPHTIVVDSVSRGIGLGKRRIDPPKHYRIGCNEGKVDGMDLSGARRHIPVRSSMVNIGTANDTSGRRNESIPGHGHGPKHVDHFFTSSSAVSGRNETYAPTWRKDPKNLLGDMCV